MSLLNPSIELSPNEIIIEKFSISKIYIFVKLIVTQLILMFFVFVMPDNYADIFSKLKLDNFYNYILQNNLFNFSLISISVNSICIFLMIYFIFYYMFYIPVSNVYMLTNKRIAVKRGWLSTEIVTYSYEKITDIFVAQSFTDRFLFGMGIIKIDTAGKGEYDMMLENIHNPEGLKAKILTIKDELYRTSIGLSADSKISE